MHDIRGKLQILKKLTVNPIRRSQMGKGKQTYKVNVIVVMGDRSLVKWSKRRAVSLWLSRKTL